MYFPLLNPEIGVLFTSPKKYSCILIIVQRDATQSSLFIILQVHSSLATLEGGSCTVPEAVVTVLCTTDDGCGWHPKHVQWTYRIINRLLCVASRWTIINRLMPNDPYMCRTAPLTSKSCILYIYSTNIVTEYFKHVLYSPVFSLQNAVCFIMLTCLVTVLFTFYIQDVIKLKKKIIPAPKG